MKRREFLSLLGGSIASLPLAADAAQRMSRVGVLWHAGNEQEEAMWLGELRRGLRDLGYSEGQNITLINTFAAEQYDRFARNARDLVEQRVDVSSRSLGRRHWPLTKRRAPSLSWPLSYPIRLPAVWSQASRGPAAT
jgi:hypothetical protein